MKKTAIFLALAGTFAVTDAVASTTEMVVTNVQPIQKTVTRYQDVPYNEQVCYRMQRNSDGLLEKVVDGGFGSTEGLVGGAIGYGIGNEIGGGSGNEIAKVLGTILGNKIGNNIANNKPSSPQQCETRTTYKRESYRETVTTGYKVTGDLFSNVHSGTQVTVERPHSPAIGSTIYVNYRVW